MRARRTLAYAVGLDGSGGGGIAGGALPADTFGVGASGVAVLVVRRENTLRR